MAEWKQLFCTLYSPLGTLYIRTLGTEEWTKLPHYSGLESIHLDNVIKPTFKPGMMSVTQENEDAHIVDDRLMEPVYLWRSTFSFPELYNVRVKEYRIGHSPSLNLLIIRVEVLAVCKTPPASQLLETIANAEGEIMFTNCAETSASVPSSWTIADAELSDRWTHGDQEIRLTFNRLTQSVEPRKDTPQPQERITGTKDWIWNAFLAFLCGSEWSAPTREALKSAKQMSLEHVVTSKSGNPFVEFEKMDDDWILIKPKHAHPASIGGPPVTVASTLSSSLCSADPSASTAPFQGANVSQSVSYEKKNEVEDVHDVGTEKTRKLERRSQLEGETVEMGAHAQAWRDVERHAREMAEQAERAEDKHRHLRLWLERMET